MVDDDIDQSTGGELHGGGDGDRDGEFHLGNAHGQRLPGGGWWGTGECRAQ